MTAWRAPIVRQAETSRDNGEKDHGTGSQPVSAAVAIREPPGAARAKPRSFAGAIMQLFREVKKAITGAAPAPHPRQRRRRTDETWRGFKMATGIMRRVVHSIFHPWEPPAELDDAQRQQLYWNDQASMHQFQETHSFHCDESNHLSPHL